MKPNNIDEINKVENEEANEGHNEERFPAISVRQRSSKQSEYN